MDLVLALSLLLLVSLAVAGLGSRMRNRRGVVPLALAALGLTLGHVLFLSDRLALAAWVPWSGIVGVALALPLPLVTLFLALLWPRLAGTPSQRLRLVVPLGGLTLWLALGSLVGAPPVTSAAPPGKDGVVLQTSEVSCSAASAATLLHAAAIPTTETELAALCLTRSSGTPMLGVYRALRLKTDSTPWRVRVLSRASVAQLRAATKSSPVLISVGLDRWQRGYDSRYVTQWGWTPGKRHAVVVFGFLPNGKLDMGDPSVGREKWSEESLETLWNGEGIQLVRR